MNPQKLDINKYVSVLVGIFQSKLKRKYRCSGVSLRIVFLDSGL